MQTADNTAIMARMSITASNGIKVLPLVRRDLADAEGKVTRWEYNRNNRPAKVTDADGRQELSSGFSDSVWSRCVILRMVQEADNTVVIRHDPAPPSADCQSGALRVDCG